MKRAAFILVGTMALSAAAQPWHGSCACFVTDCDEPAVVAVNRDDRGDGVVECVCECPMQRPCSTWPDLNADCRIDLADFLILQSHFGEVAP